MKKYAILMMAFLVLFSLAVAPVMADQDQQSDKPKVSIKSKPARTVPASEASKTTADGTKILDLLPVYDGDVYGEVSIQDPWDVKWDGQKYFFCAYVDAPDGVAWQGGVQGEKPYKVSLAGLNRSGQADPVGVWIGPKAIEFAFEPCKASRLYLPMVSNDGRQGWGWIYPSRATITGSENGYGKIDFPDTGKPSIVE